MSVLQWTADADAHDLTGECLRIPAPESGARRARWQHVLAGRRRAAPVATARPADVIVAYSPAGCALAEQLGAVLRRRVWRIGGAGELVRAVPEAADGSILLVAPRAALDHSLLSRLAALADACHCGLGVVSGLDEPAMWFHAAKLITVRKQPVTDWHVLAGHGDGGHVRPARGGPVLCGLVDAPVGKCTGTACARDVGAEGFALARELDAERVALRSCNGLAVDDVRVPGGLSLALALLDGAAVHVAAVSGQIAQTVESKALHADEMLHGATDLYPAAMAASLTSEFGEPTVVLLGDPLADGRSASNEPSAAGPGTAAARLSSTLGAALGEPAAALAAAMREPSPEADRALADALMSGIARYGDTMLTAELGPGLRTDVEKNTCPVCANTTDVITGQGAPLVEVCPICGPVQVRERGDRVVVTPAMPGVQWHCGESGMIRFGSVRGILGATGPVAVGLRMNGSRGHRVHAWDGLGPLVLTQPVSWFLPPDTYFVQYAIVRHGHLVYGRIRITVG